MFAIMVVALGALFATIPNPQRYATARPDQTSLMRYRASRDGPSGGRQRSWIDLSQLSAVAACAVVKSEDRMFFVHRGVDLREMRYSIVDALTGRRVRGGSTISMQLARNLYLDSERSLLRKTREILIAARLESVLTKERILELYLNVVEWGDGVWGISDAARHYFGIDATRLGAFEASFLSALLPAPRAPLVGANLARAAAVQERVLRQLEWAGAITADDWSIAMQRAVILRGLLRDGVPLRQALNSARSVAPPPLPPPWHRSVSIIAERQLLAAGCGLANELGVPPQGPR